tara:strand:- start:3611 stop:4648 length:1038 start_codon:yes stop_codon:yes gene_type:complete
MAIRPYAGGGAQAFQGDNQPLYVQNQNELKKAFNQVQASSISGAAPIGSVIMWAGTSANAPSTYAVCNGASLSTTGTYAALFAVIGYRYGGSGANFNLPDFHSNVLNPTGSVPVGISVNPTVPSTKTTSAASAVDVHTHSVNSSLTATGAPNASLALALTAGNSSGTFVAGNAASHTHSGGVLTAGNADAHAHAVIGNTGDTSVNHAHTGNTSGPSTNHSHTYFRPNTGANASTTIQSSNHTHSYTTDNSAGTNHSHTLFFNSANNSAAVNSTITAPGAPNATIGVNSTWTAGAVNSTFSAGNANTHTHAGSVLTAGTASTINAQTPAHTHTTATTQIIFIIRVS